MQLDERTAFACEELEFGALELTVGMLQTFVQSHERQEEAA
ncbi:hypothetical protein [Mesorhizobium sp. ES1-1]|nr:hypothetical protein [Mesorhizobium sp. ES1-1]